MKKGLLIIVGVLMLGVAFAAPKPVSIAKDAPVFTKEQQSAIQMIVHQYLVQHPEVLVEVSQALQQKQMQAVRGTMIDVVRANADQFLRDSNSPVVGDPNGSVTLIAFFDYNCPYCRSMAKIMIEMMKQDKNLRVVFKEFPIHGAPAIFAAKAALAANQQGKYIDLHEAMMSAPDELTEQKVLLIAAKLGLDMKKLQADMKQAAIQDEITNNAKLAQQLQVPGTPAFIIVKTNLQNNGKGDIEAAPGMVPAETLKQLVTQVRNS